MPDLRVALVFCRGCDTSRQKCDLYRALGKLGCCPECEHREEEPMTDEEVKRAARDLTDAHGGTARAWAKARAHGEKYPEGHPLRHFWTRVQAEVSALAAEKKQPPPSTS
jgi:hypothetical protein